MGRAPVLFNPVEARITLSRAQDIGKVEIYAINPTDNSLGKKVKYQARGKEIIFNIGPEFKTIYYYLVIP